MSADAHPGESRTRCLEFQHGVGRDCARHRLNLRKTILYFLTAIAILLGGTSSLPAVLAATFVSVDSIGPINLAEYKARGKSHLSGNDPRVALALSGGAARGLAQIGVLRAFEESGITFDVICGVSMGAIIGGLYAAGIGPDSLETLVRSTDWGPLLKNAPPRTRLLFSQKEKTATWLLSQPLEGFKPRWPTGAFSGQGFYNFLSRLTQGASYRSGANFDRLRIRYRAVATDLVTGERAVFDDGELAFAMRAAMAFPLAVTPLREGGHLYADGGLIDPLPVGLARELSDCPVVAVNTSTGLAPIEQLGDPYSVANQATTVMTARSLDEALRAADFVCSPAVEGIANVGFGDIDTLIALGYTAGREAAVAILARLNCPTDDPADPLAQTSHPIRLSDHLTLDDCPSPISDWVRSEASISHRILRDTIGALIEQGKWHSATLTTYRENPGEHAYCVLDATLPLKLNMIVFEGVTVFPITELETALRLAVGRPFHPDTLAAGLNRITRLYEEREYTLIDITEVRFDDRGILTVSIDEAPLAGIRLEGNQSVKSWVILRNFPLRPGVPYNARKVSRGLTDLQATGLFDQVTTDVVRTDDGPLLRLVVTEKTTDALRIGLHHNSEYQTEGFLQWANINLFGLGNELTAHAQFSDRRELYFLRIQSDRIFRSYVAATLRGYYDRHERRRYRDHERIGTFTARRTGFEAQFAQNISRIAQFAVRLGSEEIEYSIDSTEDRFRHSRFALIARLDDLDRAHFPRRGRRINAVLTWADDFINGDLVYRAFTADGLWVVSPLENLSIGAGGQFATADRPLPLHERIGLGGRRSFMGFADDELLEVHLVRATLTARYKFYPFSYVVLRGDAGNAWAHGAEIDFWSALRFGVGGGLEIDTPIGPLVILQGFADNGEDKFYFSWGYDF